MLQREVRRLAVENSAVSEEVWKQLEEAERELATARIDLEACRFKIADLEKEAEGNTSKAKATQGDLRNEVQRCGSPSPPARDRTRELSDVTTVEQAPEVAGRSGAPKLRGQVV